MKKLNKLAVKVMSVAIAVMLLSSQSIFASGRYEYGVITGNTYGETGHSNYYEKDGSGGVFYINTPVTLTINDNAQFNTNYASDNGGSIYNNKGTVSIGKNAKFVENGTDAGYGGAIYNEDGTFIIGNGVEFNNNAGYNHGGAIYNNKGAITIGNNAKFANNISEEGKGGAIFNTQGTINIGDNAEFSKNNSEWYGVAIYNDKGTITIGNNVKFTEHYSSNGFVGAVYNEETMTIGSGAIFKKNYAKAIGAVKNDGTMTIESNAQFIENKAATYSGAIYNMYGTFTIKDGATFKDNTAKEESGAIYNFAGTVNLIANTNNIEFTGNKQYTGMENEESNAIYDYNGTINLWANSNANITFNDKIIDAKDSNSSVLNINKIISGYQETAGTGTIVLNEDMSGYKGTTNFCGGTIELGENGKWFGGKVNIVDVDNATINFANGLVEEHNFNTVKVSGNLNLPVVNADLKNEKMDTISSATEFEGSGKITVNKVKVIKDTKEKEVTITFADDKLKDKVEFSGNVETLFYKYTATYDDTTGAFTFVNEGGINMASAASAVASSVGGYATQSVVINQAFAGIDRQMAQKVQPKTVAPKATVKPSQESSVTPTDKKQPVKINSKQNKKSANINSSNLYVSAGNQIFDDSGKIERSLWLRPFALQETIKLNGVDIDNTLYGTLAGIDLPIGQDKQLSFYIGYAGSKQEFDEVKTNQTGYLVGLTGMLVKEKWYLGVTVNGIFNKVSADSEDETNDFDMNMFTIGAKAGYNIDLSDKWILEPNITVMYGIANSDSYETSLGSIDSQSTSNILVEPQVKAKWQLTNGWQPYGLVGYSANLSGKPKVKAGGEELELDSIDGFVEYGIGVNKEFIGSVWSCYGQVTGRSGGRNGFGGNLGIKYKF